MTYASKRIATVFVFTLTVPTISVIGKLSTGYAVLTMIIFDIDCPGFMTRESVAMSTCLVNSFSNELINKR
jgi:hypothetical protein